MEHSYFRVMSSDKCLNLGYRLPNDGDFHTLFNDIKNFLHKDETAYTIRYKGLDIYPLMKVEDIARWKTLYDTQNPECTSANNAMNLVLRLSENVYKNNNTQITAPQTTAFKAKELKSNIESRKKIKKILEENTRVPTEIINKIMLYVPYNITTPPHFITSPRQPRGCPRNTTWRADCQ